MEITSRQPLPYKKLKLMTRQFEFTTGNNSLTSGLKQMLEFINDNLVANVPAISLLFKSKIILTELLTNALKHSFSRCTLIDITIESDGIVITKTDYGMPLSLIAYTNSLESKIPITNDILHTLYAIPEGKDKVRFGCEESTLDDLESIERIVEHFGLIIITKATDKFVYQYNEKTKANIFTATLNF
jgi:anti-sigma regulatory factor (Ser/Thr protein kinase)